MSVLPGGVKCNLITSYRTGLDDDLKFGWTVTLAQSFTIPTTNVIYQAVALIGWMHGDHRLECHLHYTDAAGKPTGAPIDVGYHQFEDRYAPWPLQQRIFKFPNMPTLPAGQYAIEIKSLLSGELLLFEWGNDKTAPTYGGGKAWRSLNGGGSFAELAGRDFIFEIWGWEPPPIPPPPPTPGNWAPLDMVYEHTASGLRIIVTTDIPVHLFMRWTYTKPRTHPQALVRRGISLPYATRWCFTNFHENEQIEAGDTLTHTFLKYPWPVCETRYFYFTGTKQGEEQPSASPIFKLHRLEPPPPATFFFPYDHQELIVTADHAWHDLKVPPLNEPLSSLLPSDTVGIFLHHWNSGGNERLGLRPKGSGWNRFDLVRGGQHHWAHVGVDSNIRAEAWLDDSVTQKLWLEGYVVAGGAVYFVDPILKTPALFNMWVEIDLSAACPGAVGILAENYSIPSGWLWGIRKHGSTDNRTRGSSHTWPIIGCDINQKIDYYTGFVAGAPMELYIWGYIPDHAAFQTNAPNITPFIYGSYQTIPVAPPAGLAFIEVHSAIANVKYDLRPNGKLWDTYEDLTEQHGWAVVGLNEADELQAKIQNNNLTIHLIGIGI